MEYIKDFKISKILFIKGVFIKDCVQIDDIFEQQLIDRLDEEEKTIIKYQKMPSVFTSLNTWIEKINIKCWYCDLFFESKPLFIPRIIEPSPIGYNIGTEGCFCSFSCAMSYINLNFPKIYDNVRKHEMLKFLYKIFNKNKICEILSSPNRYEMEHYGGNMDINTYRIKVNEINNQMEKMSTKIKDS